MAAQPTVVSSLNLSGAEKARSILRSSVRLVEVPDRRDTVLNAIEEGDAYLASAAVKVDQEFVDRAPRLRLIGSPHTGTDHIDFDVVQARNIPVITITREQELLRSFTATAEHTFGLLLSVVRQIGPAAAAACEGDWARSRFTGFQLHQKTFGVLGLGRLGSMAARMAQGFGMNVIAHDIAERHQIGVTIVGLKELLRRSDVLSIHVHLNEGTRRMIGADAFETMKPNSILINTSRGGIVDETSLLLALKNRRLAAAGIDVIDGEWLSQDDLHKHPLIAYARENANLLITPHIGGSTVESIAGARIFMAKRMVSHFERHS